MNLKKFTLIEMLTVMAIIAILITASTMSYSRIILSQRIAQAKSTMDAIVASALTYQTAYGSLPWIDGSAEVLDCNASNDDNTPSFTDESYKNYRLLFTILTAQNYRADEDLKKTAKSRYKNKRETTFFTPPANYGTTDFDLRDPWGNFYVFYVDINGDGRPNALKGLESFTVMSYGPTAEGNAKVREELKHSIEEWGKSSTDRIGYHIWNGVDGILCTGYTAREEEEK